jgi:hypothetical protein
MYVYVHVYVGLFTVFVLSYSGLVSRFGRRNISLVYILENSRARSFVSLPYPPDLQVENSPPSSAEVKNAWSSTYTPHTPLCRVQGKLFTFIFV